MYIYPSQRGKLFIYKVVLFLFCTSCFCAFKRPFSLFRLLAGRKKGLDHQSFVCLLTRCGAQSVEPMPVLLLSTRDK